MRDLIAQNLLVHSDENQPFQLRLRHQKPVEWVAMRLRKRPCTLRLLDGDGQGQEVVLLNGFSNRFSEDQLPRSPLDGNLPNRSRTDKDLVPRRSNCRAKCVRQMGIV